MRKQHVVQLTDDERAALEQQEAGPLTRRQRYRVQVLLRADAGEEIADEAGVSAGTVPEEAAIRAAVAKLPALLAPGEHIKNGCAVSVPCAVASPGRPVPLAVAESAALGAAEDSTQALAAAGVAALCRMLSLSDLKRRRPDSNRGITDLQSKEDVTQSGVAATPEAAGQARTGTDKPGQIARNPGTATRRDLLPSLPDPIRPPGQAETNQDKPRPPRATGCATGPAEDQPAADGVETPPMPPDLAAVVAAWPSLPEAVRAGIVAMVRAARGRE